MPKPDPTAPKPPKPDSQVDPQGGFVRPAREDGTDLTTDGTEPTPQG